jgi:hypothetical protein
MTSPQAGPGTAHEAVPGPEAESYVVLDIGADIGALVLHGPPDLLGTEIEISLADSPESPRTHSLVRERRVRSTSTYAAVYPGLQAGTYTIWRDASTPAGTVLIEGGQVASWHWQDG